MKSGFISVALAALLLCGAAAAQDPRAAEAAREAQAAERAMARGDAAAAEAAYSRVLAARPSDAAALVGRGNARAVQKNYTGARADFDAVLAREPAHVGALVGLGYTLAWSGRHAEAVAQFDRVLRIAPGHADAQRGAAYAELWRGDAAAAVARFERVLAQAPQDADARRGLAEARAKLEGPRALFEASLWAGRTRLPQGGSESGLRLAELALWPNPNARLFIRYDDGLSRDNAALAQAGRSAALKSVGGYWRWSERQGTSLELGLRSNPDGVDEQVLRAEHTLYLPGGHEAKAGGWHGRRNDDRTEWLVQLGGAAAVTERLRIEPMLFYSRDGLPGSHEWRALLAANQRLANGWELGGGIALGRAQTALTDADKREGFLRASVSLSEAWRLQALARRETTQGGGSTTVFALGAGLAWR